jgi:hypothetical protein
VLTKIQMVGHRVKFWRIIFGECGMCVLAMEALLEPVNPAFISMLRLEFPVGDQRA